MTNNLVFIPTKKSMPLMQVNQEMCDESLYDTGDLPYAPSPSPTKSRMWSLSPLQTRIHKANKTCTDYSIQQKIT